MELNIKTTVVQLNNGSTVQLYDSSLDYNAITNPGGWCINQLGPNPRRADVTGITIKIAKGDLEETISYTDQADLDDYLDPTFGKLLDAPTLFGAAYAVFEDGIYSITITMEGNWYNPDTELYEDFTKYDEITEALLWSMWNEIRHLVITVQVPIINYQEAYNISLMNMLFDSIIYNCQYGNADNAQLIIDYLTDVLENNTSLTELFKNFENYG
jgi:hypothetical protein